MFSHSFYTAGGDINVKFYNTLQFNVGGDILYFNMVKLRDYASGKRRDVQRQS